MIRVEAADVIKKPVAEVFAYVADMSTHPRWDHGCVEAAYTTPPPIRVGTAYRRVDKVMGRRMKGTGEVLEYEPSKRITWSMSPPTPGKVVITCEPVEGGTRVQGVFEATLQGLMKLLQPLMGMAFSQGAKKSIRNLKARLEGPG